MPCIVRWPGVIPPGETSAALIAAIDLLPTLCEPCGIDLADVAQESHPIDGVNVWPTLVNQNNKDHPRTDLLYWHGAKGFQAIRVGDWKLFPDRKAAQLTGTGPALFHLADDVAESTDLSKEHPEKVKSMQALAEKRLADIQASVIPLASPKSN